MTLQSTWIWPAALYLFLGGLSAGTFLAAGAMCVLRYRRFRKVWRIAFLAAPAMLAAGLGLLVFELVKPAQILVFWQSFSNGSSWMAWGAWAALLCVIVFLVCGIFELPGPSGWLSDVLGGVPFLRERVKTVLVGLGIAGAAFITVYTGMLLFDAGGVPFWHTAWLPALFCISAINAGASLTIIIAGTAGLIRQISRSTQRTISAIGFGLTTAETIAISIYLAVIQAGNIFDHPAQALAATTSAQLLTSGAYAPVFWILVMGLGLTVPMVVYLLGIVRHRGLPVPMLLACCIFSIVSDAVLRFLILYAGVFTDYFGPILSAL